MSKTRIVQYVHRPNSTELGLGNTHETYMLINSDIDLSELFPESVEVTVEDTDTQKTYKLKSANGREFRVNQMGEIYRDHNVSPGDEILITQISKDGNTKLCITAKKYNRVVLMVGSNGAEIANINRLNDVISGGKSYHMNIYDRGKQQILEISFKEAKKKRSDSPSTTDYYNVTVDGASLPTGTYYLTLSERSTISTLVKSSFNEIVFDDNMLNDTSVSTKVEHRLQQIYYGAPGTGKSHTIKDTTDAEPKENVFRTTFHPDSDYSTFVGCYKPTMKTRKSEGILSVTDLTTKLKEIKASGVSYPCHKFAAKYWESLKDLDTTNIKSILTACEFTDSMNVEILKGIAIGQEISSTSCDDKIIYSFVPQSFTKAYIRAWQTEEPVYLVIEEINRGNCAQIFGDLFQLLDRGDDGCSEYPIKADNDLAMYLAEQLSSSERTDIPEMVKNGDELVLPSNLHIWATMNTSDQSLFPIDSAFKRRWEWKYVPIKEYSEKNWKIEIDSKEYNWWGFLSKINQVIGETTCSEDKKLGYFFVKANDDVIDAEKFVSKVLFYLWNDVFKTYGFEHSIFTKEDNQKFEFSDFFLSDGSANTSMTIKFLEKLDDTIDREKSFR